MRLPLLLSRFRSAPRATAPAAPAPGLEPATALLGVRRAGLLRRRVAHGAALNTVSELASEGSDAREVLFRLLRR